MVQLTTIIFIFAFASSPTITLPLPPDKGSAYYGYTTPGGEDASWVYTQWSPLTLSLIYVTQARIRSPESVGGFKWTIYQCNDMCIFLWSAVPVWQILILSRACLALTIVLHQFRVMIPSMFPILVLVHWQAGINMIWMQIFQCEYILWSVENIIFWFHSLL